jgi:hypothetical protein
MQGQESTRIAKGGQKEGIRSEFEEKRMARVSRRGHRECKRWEGKGKGRKKLPRYQLRVGKCMMIARKRSAREEGRQHRSNKRTESGKQGEGKWRARGGCSSRRARGGRG